ncbi:MAG: YceI family protein [Acidimicrobiia bacterium]
MSSRTKYLVAIAAAGLVVAAAGIWFVFFRDTAPDAVNLDDAVGSVTSTTTAPASGSTTTVPADDAPDDDAPSEAAPLDGTWIIDTTAGGGTVEEGSFVGYRVQEELASIGAKTAVGRTTALSGSFTFEGSALSAASVVADLTQLKSDSGGRDGQMRTQSLETNTFPEATFTLTSPVELGAAPADGESFSVQAEGDLTIHGVTQSVIVPIAGQVVGETVVVVGLIQIVFEDYQIDKPESFRVLSVEDIGEMEFQLFLTRS